MELRFEDIAILLALYQDPFMSMSELSRQVKIPESETTERYHFLKEKGVIKNPIAIYNPESLGLQRIHVITVLPDFPCLEIMEELCNAHPYTHYRTRIFGGNIGLFIQFDIPSGTREKIEKLFEKLVEQKMITSFEISESSGVRTESYPNLDKYNAGTSSWSFIWPIWFAALEVDPPPLPFHSKFIKNLTNFTPAQAQILRFLTSNASLSIEELCNKTDLNKEVVEKEYPIVKENYVGAIRFIYDREIFDLTETILAFGSEVDLRRQEQLYNGIKIDAPPFFLSLDILQNNKILIWITMSPGQASDFTYACWQNIPNFKIQVLDTKSQGSMLYCFYPDNFDFANRKWKSSTVYMVDEPLQSTKKALVNIQK
ncbi:MAG: Lrp/AsnC family transcriptional regulator [Candidatus Hodarchaeales archaeon]|jgi:DNA-binding Lrp family transcriptional regulator